MAADSRHLDDLDGLISSLRALEAAASSQLSPPSPGYPSQQVAPRPPTPAVAAHVDTLVDRLHQSLDALGALARTAGTATAGKDRAFGALEAAPTLQMAAAGSGKASFSPLRTCASSAGREARGLPTERARGRSTMRTTSGSAASLRPARRPSPWSCTAHQRQQPVREKRARRSERARRATDEGLPLRASDKGPALGSLARARTESERLRADCRALQASNAALRDLLLEPVRQATQTPASLLAAGAPGARRSSGHAHRAAELGAAHATRISRGMSAEPAARGCSQLSVGGWHRDRAAERRAWR
jgi:hypothetical protein